MGQEKHFLCIITPLFQGDGKISKHPLPGFWVLVLHGNMGWGGSQWLLLAFWYFPRYPRKKDDTTSIFQSSCTNIFSKATSVLLACTLHCPSQLQTAPVSHLSCTAAKFNCNPSLLSPTYLALKSSKLILSNFDILIAFGRFPFQRALWQLNNSNG